MSGVDEWIGNAAAGHGALVVVIVAFALGLRHASDPDHLVAVSTLVADGRARAGRAAAVVGAAWGAGHALTLLAFGLPVILLQTFLPHVVETLAEALIGAIIVVLALRLLRGGRRGSHTHRVRSPRQAFGIGLVHGLAGSAGVAVLILAAVPDRTTAAVALVVMSAGTLLSMALLSAGFGRAFAAATARRALARTVPGLAALACLFGVWYAAAAVLAL